jgi:zinc protease
MSHLYQRIRELRGMNYGDYAYIEAFPGGMYRSFPEPNAARRAQLFEVWIRPVVPANGPMALKIALHELDTLIRDGISESDFQATRDYLMKNVYLLTSTQEEELGYALDSKWYGIGDYVPTMRGRLAKLTRADVNAAVRKHLSAAKLAVVVITKDAEGLREKLLSPDPSTIAYDSPKPPEVLAEDEVIGARKLGLTPERVRITPVADVFAR